MTHDALAILLTVFASTLAGLATLAYQNVCRRLGRVEQYHRLYVATLYHVVTETPIPEKLKVALEVAMMNGKGSQW